MEARDCRFSLLGTMDTSGRGGRAENGVGGGPIGWALAQSRREKGRGRELWLVLRGTKSLVWLGGDSG